VAGEACCPSLAAGLALPCYARLCGPPRSGRTWRNLANCISPQTTADLPINSDYYATTNSFWAASDFAASKFAMRREKPVETERLTSVTIELRTGIRMECPIATGPETCVCPALQQFVLHLCKPAARFAEMAAKRRSVQLAHCQLRAEDHRAQRCPKINRQPLSSKRDTAWQERASVTIARSALACKLLVI
jgi:hypothetical protein